MAKYFHHWLFTLLIVIFCQFYINEIVFLMIDIWRVYIPEASNPLVPNTTPLFNDVYARF